VIVATGVWWMPQRYFSGHGVDAVADLFVRDITQGIGETGIKAAIIKCATDTAGVTPVIENILRASARAQKATGVPISTHTWAAGRTGEAQQAKKVYRIGWLGAGSAALTPKTRENFLQGLRDLGYVEGQGFVMEYRFAEGQADRLPELAADLVRVHVDVIVTSGTPATYAAMQATKTIPIVFGSAGNVVEKGIVASLTRPGGNVTGLTLQLGYLKLYQVLKEAAPKVARGVYLYDPGSNPRDVAERLRSLAQAEKVEWQSVALRNDPNGVA
jgi:hypothetical protein